MYTGATNNPRRTCFFGGAEAPIRPLADLILFRHNAPLANGVVVGVCAVVFGGVVLVAIRSPVLLALAAINRDSRRACVSIMWWF